VDDEPSYRLHFEQCDPLSHEAAAEGVTVETHAEDEIQVVRELIEASPQSPSEAAPFSAWSFNDRGDRIVQLLRLPVGNIGSVSILNTHLTFPKNASDRPIRKQQACKLANLVRAIKSEKVLCFGDLNGDVSPRLPAHDRSIRRRPIIVLRC
jgi:hypothetical protein